MGGKGHVGANELPDYISHSCGKQCARRAAQKTMARLRELYPTLRVSNVKEWAAFRRPEDLARLEEGLRKATLPE
jgi:hypothetical protein